MDMLGPKGPHNLCWDRKGPDCVCEVLSSLMSCIELVTLSVRCVQGYGPASVGSWTGFAWIYRRKKKNSCGGAWNVDVPTAMPAGGRRPLVGWTSNRQGVQEDALENYPNSYHGTGHLYHLSTKAAAAKARPRYDDMTRGDVVDRERTSWTVFRSVRGYTEKCLGLQRDRGENFGNRRQVFSSKL